MSLAGTIPQHNPHLGLSAEDQNALAAHRLTVRNVRQMFAVDRELLQLLKDDPELDARAAEREKQFDAEHLGIVAVGAMLYEAMPETASILARQKISGRDYLLTKMVAMIVEIADGAPRRGPLATEGVDDQFFLAPALKFWTTLGPALKAEAAEWVEVRRELEKHGRRRVW